jgi:hypothetical protein
MIYNGALIATALFTLFVFPFYLFSRAALFFLDTNRMGGDATSVCRVDGPDVFMTADCKDPEVDCSCCDVCCRDGESNCNAAEVMANVDDGYVRDQFVFSDNLVFYKNVDPAN